MRNRKSMRLRLVLQLKCFAICFVQHELRQIESFLKHTYNGARWFEFTTIYFKHIRFYFSHCVRTPQYTNQNRIETGAKLDDDRRKKICKEGWNEKANTRTSAHTHTRAGARLFEWITSIHLKYFNSHSKITVLQIGISYRHILVCVQLFCRVGTTSWCIHSVCDSLFVGTFSQVYVYYSQKICETKSLKFIALQLSSRKSFGIFRFESL